MTLLLPLGLQFAHVHPEGADLGEMGVALGDRLVVCGSMMTPTASQSSADLRSPSGVTAQG
jgi:hypothetical protein